MANGRFAMPIPLRRDFEASRLRLAARRTKDGPQARRFLALAAIYEGATRSEAARIGGVTLQIVRDWVLKFNAQGPNWHPYIDLNVHAAEHVRRQRL